MFAQRKGFGWHFYRNNRKTGAEEQGNCISVKTNTNFHIIGSQFRNTPRRGVAKLFGVSNCVYLLQLFHLLRLLEHTFQFSTLSIYLLCSPKTYRKTFLSQRCCLFPLVFSFCSYSSVHCYSSILCIDLVALPEERFQN